MSSSELKPIVLPALLPCPFCGSAAVWVSDKKDHWRACCSSDLCDMEPSTEHCWAEHEIILEQLAEVWNTRAESAKDLEITGSGRLKELTKHHNERVRLASGDYDGFCLTVAELSNLLANAFPELHLAITTKDLEIDALRTSLEGMKERLDRVEGQADDAIQNTKDAIRTAECWKATSDHMEADRDRLRAELETARDLAARLVDKYGESK